MNEESDDELPANWQEGKTGDGRIFYINHQTQQTQWEHPVTKKVKVISTGKDLLFHQNKSLISIRITVRLEGTYRTRREHSLC